MPERTKGPWKVVCGAVETENGIPIAKMDRETGNGTVPVERDANAYLIASAPDMRDAIIGLLTAIENSCILDSFAPSVDALHEAIGKAEEALAKGSY